MLLPPGKSGKLWYDDKGTLEERITKALRYYAKLGLEFDTVFIHSDMVPEEPVECDVQIRVGGYTLRHHFLFCNLENGEQAVGAQPAVTRTGG